MTFRHEFKYIFLDSPVKFGEAINNLEVSGLHLPFGVNKRHHAQRFFSSSGILVSIATETTERDVVRPRVALLALQLGEDQLARSLKVLVGCQLEWDTGIQ